jgi:site-specific DNA-methyltransferase (adenine-specific)
MKIQKKRDYNMLENQIICGNNTTVLNQLPDQSIDLVVTSPPYDEMRDYNGYTFNWEVFTVLAQCLYRKMKIGGVIVWIVNDQQKNNAKSGTSYRQALYFMDCGFKLYDNIIWDKGGFRLPFLNHYHQVYENMFILSKDDPKTVHLIRDRKVKNAGMKHEVSHMIREKDGTMRPSSKQKIHVYPEFSVRYNIWTIYPTNTQSDRTALEHPAAFPDQLAEDHILSWSNPDDLVVDPFNGSGTTCKMAYLNNRKYIGIDCSAEYCALAEKRLYLTTPQQYQATKKQYAVSKLTKLGEY